MLANLSETVCPAEVRDGFMNRIVGISNDVVGDESFRWLFVNERGFALWGVACQNKMLDPNYSKDKFPRGIRGFTGYVIPNYSGEPLARDIDVFKEIFRKVMAPIFDDYVQKQLADVTIDVGSETASIRPKPFDGRLNTDYHQCRLFSSTADADSLLASCLSYRNDISIALNVLRSESVTTPKYHPVMNAVMHDAMTEETTDVPVMHICAGCGKATYDLHEGICQKCWEERQPHCRRCGKRTSKLNDGLCQACWDELHPSIPKCESCGKETYDLHEGLCSDCYGHRHPRCRNCGKRVNTPTALSSRGLCAACERKRIQRLWIGFSLAFLLCVLLSFVRFDKTTHSFRFQWPSFEMKGLIKQNDSKGEDLPKQNESQWTRQECEEYLAQYTKSLNSENVRQRLRLLFPQPTETKPKEAENTQITASVHCTATKTQEDSGSVHKNTVLNLIDQPQPSGYTRQNAAGSGRDVPKIVGCVVLSVLLLAFCVGVYFLVTEVFGWKHPLLAKFIGLGITIPLWKEIWN